MTTIYVVLEVNSDLDRLQNILPFQFVDQIEFVDGKTNYGAKSMATTLLALRQRPLALIVHAHADAAAEERQYANALLWQAAAGVDHAVFVATAPLPDDPAALRVHPIVQGLIAFLERVTTPAAEPVI